MNTTIEFEYPDGTHLGTAERSIKGSVQAPEHRASNVNIAKRMAAKAGPDSVAATLLRWHLAKQEAGE